MSANFLSPGVYSQETDLSQITRLSSATVAALVGAADKGPLGPRLISSDKEFVETYGIPNPSRGFAAYSALAVLRQGGAVYFNRVVGSGSTTPVISYVSGVNEGLVTQTASPSPAAFTFNASDLFVVYPIGPGPNYSDLSIRVSDVSSTDQELTLSVFSSSNPNLALESYRVSMAFKKDGFGRQMEIESVINNSSNRIRVLRNKTTTGVLAATPANAYNNIAFTGGALGASPADSDINAGWEVYKDVNRYQFSITVNAGYSTPAVQNKMIEVCEFRDDCCAILDVPSESQASASAITYRKTTLNATSSYAILVAPDYLYYDDYSDRTLYVPASGEVAARAVFTDTRTAPWRAIAGLNRGIFRNCQGLRFNYSKAEKDALFQAQVNYIEFNAGEGYALMGQRTLTPKDSALGELAVRRLLNVIKPAMARAVKYSLYEPHDDFTRAQVSQMLNEMLTQVRSGRGIIRFRVVCDATNNPPAVVNSNQLNVDVYIEPTRSIQFIKVQSVLTRAGASFEELIASGGNF